MCRENVIHEPPSVHRQANYSTIEPHVTADQKAPAHNDLAVAYTLNRFLCRGRTWPPPHIALADLASGDVPSATGLDDPVA